MSFRSQANKIRRRELPLWDRFRALRHCVTALCWLTGEPYDERLQRLGFLRYQQDTPPTEVDLLEMLEALEHERALALEELRLQSQHRRAAKWARKEAQRRDAPSYLFGMPCTTAARLQSAIAKPKGTLVFIGAPWDTSSARLGIFLSQWKASIPPWRLLVVNVDDPQHADFLHERGIQTTPTLLVFRQSQELARRLGGLPQQGTTQEHLTALQDWLAATIRKSRDGSCGVLDTGR